MGLQQLFLDVLQGLFKVLAFILLVEVEIAEGAALVVRPADQPTALELVAQGIVLGGVAENVVVLALLIHHAQKFDLIRHSSQLCGIGQPMLHFLLFE